MAATLTLAELDELIALVRQVARTGWDGNRHVGRAQAQAELDDLLDERLEMTRPV